MKYNSMEKLNNFLSWRR